MTPFTTIVSTEILSDHLKDPNWVIIDTRFDILRTTWGFEDYQRAHIPGAVYVDLNKDLSAQVTATSGRHPLPDPNQFLTRMSSFGVDGTKQVVVYDTSGGSMAARLWWMLNYYGHTSVAVLDGGFSQWQKENRSISTGTEQNHPARFTGKPDPRMKVEAAFVDQIKEDPKFRLIDARASARYQGLTEPIDSKAGHIPGAINRFHGLNLSEDGTFLSPDVLKTEFLSLLGNVKPQNTVVYCGSGVTSCHNILAMEVAGMSGARLYVGSWSEWIRDPDHPVAKESS